MFDTLERSILLMIAKKPHSSIIELFSDCAFPSSKATFYRTIANLIKNHTLVKKGTKLALNQTRITEYLYLGDIIANKIGKENDYLDLIEGQMKVYQGSSLFSIDSFWSDILSHLVQKYGQEYNLFCYNSHPYHILGMQKTEYTIQDLINKKHKQSYFLFGNNTVLDVYGENLLAMTGAKTLCVSDTEFGEEGYFLNIINNIIIQLIIPKEISNYFTFIFTQVQHIEQFNITLFEQIFHIKGDYKLRISCDTKRAKELSEKIQLHFKKDVRKKK